MIEVEKDNSRGIAGAGLGLGIAGTALGLLNGGIPNLLGGWGCSNGSMCSNNIPVTRYELGLEQENAAKSAEISLLKANTYNDQKSLELYRYIDGRFTGFERELADQRVYNATNTAALNCMNGQIAQLMGLTKLVVPNGSICPGWGDVTVSITPAPTTGA